MFKDRFDAAYQLVPHLKEYANNPNAIIIAIPRGGIQLGSVLAHELHLPLDIIFTKKIGYPGNPEYAIGAVSLQHTFIRNEFAELPGLQSYVKQQSAIIRKHLEERSQLYRGDKQPPKFTDKIVIVVDDGVATGNTLRATLLLIRQDKPQKIIVALPVAPPATLATLRNEADDIICLMTPENFYGVSQFYTAFDQVDDSEAIRLLQKAQV
jgi:putative phosphoribosyl transferase